LTLISDRFGLWIAATVCALVLTLSGCTDSSAPSEPFFATDITGADFGRDFRLVDHHGKTRTLADFKGKAVLLFFGYTHCPDVCLTTLLELAMAQKRLGGDASRVQVLFVTLDPARDTPEKLANFVTYFHQDFLALSGDEATIAKTAKEFKAYYAKHDSGSAAGYFLDHSAGIYGFDAHGRLRILISYGTDLAAIVHDVKLLLGGKP
jgi:protein SCO1/2